MKYVSISLFICLFSLTVCAQTKGTVKLYGYKQSVSTGMVNKVISEGGQEVPTAQKPRYNYMFYVVSTGRVYPSEMWIKGEAYSVRAEVISKTPVMHQGNPSSTNITLVPKTTQKVLMLTPAPAIAYKQHAIGKKLAATNEFVLVYKQNGKFFYNTISKLKQLDTAAMQ